MGSGTIISCRRPQDTQTSLECHERVVQGNLTVQMQPVQHASMPCALATAQQNQDMLQHAKDKPLLAPCRCAAISIHQLALS